MFNTPESANAAVERYEAQPDESASKHHKAMKGCTDFFLERIFSEDGKKNTEEAYWLERFATVALEDFDSDTVCQLLCLSLTDACEAGAKLKEIAMINGEFIAKEYREYLEPLAREAGYIKE